MQKLMDKVMKSNNNDFDNVKGAELISTNASIPSKYQTIVIIENDKKGFLTTSKRFKNITNDIPGPGKYVTHSAFESSSSSFSVKGTGGLASMTKRKFSLSSATNGGPFVSLPSSFSSKRDFNRSGNTRPFQKQIAEQMKRFSLPAPNQYQINSQPKKTMSAEAVFRSKTKRDFLNYQGNAPGPCEYSVNYDFVLSSSKAVTVPFKSKSQRTLAVEEYSVPGPGTYNPNVKVAVNKKPTILKKHYLCLSAPAQQQLPQPEIPGPGTYDIPVDIFKKTKKFISSSAFVSTTKRLDLSADTHVPGPASYNLFMPPKKQSFFLNVDTKWV